MSTASTKLIVSSVLAFVFGIYLIMNGWSYLFNGYMPHKDRVITNCKVTGHFLDQSMCSCSMLSIAASCTCYHGYLNVFYSVVNYGLKSTVNSSIYMNHKPTRSFLPLLKRGYRLGVTSLCYYDKNIVTSVYLDKDPFWYLGMSIFLFIVGTVPICTAVYISICYKTSP